MQDDKKIFDEVMKHGPKNWSLIATHLPGRTGKQCRERGVTSLEQVSDSAGLIFWAELGWAEGPRERETFKNVDLKHM